MYAKDAVQSDLQAEHGKTSLELINKIASDTASYALPSSVQYATASKPTPVEPKPSDPLGSQSKESLAITPVPSIPSASPPTIKRQTSLEAPETGDVFLGVKRLPAGSVKIAKETILGSGAFGLVYEGAWQKRPVAIKEIDIERAGKNLGLEKDQVLEALSWEVSRLASTSHANLVQFFGIYNEKDQNFLILEYCEGGSLQKMLSQNPPWSLRWQWALEVSQGLAYLHHQGILHRDLKAENILLDGQKRARLADLGVAQVDALLQRKEAYVVAEGLQDLNFIAPEQVENRTLSTAATDIYALGIVFWQIVTGKKPRNILIKNESSDTVAFDDTILTEMRKGERESIPVQCPAEFKKLILDCWQVAPEKRPKIEHIISRLNDVGTAFHKQSHWVKFCESIDMEIHPAREELLKYIPPYVTQYQVLEDLDTYWKRFEVEDDKREKESHEIVKLRSEEIFERNPPLPITSIIASFLAEKNPATLLLLGESGLGKTLSAYQLANSLLSDWWQMLQNPKEKEATPYLPVFIRANLTRWSHSELTGALDKALKKYDLNIPAMELKNARLLVIVDGYDECQVDIKPQNLAVQLGLNALPNAKLLIISRPVAVDAQELQLRFALQDNLTVRYFLPFSILQISNYLAVGYNWETEAYKKYYERINTSAELRSVLRNPFVLNLFLQSIEKISEQELNQLERWHIYQKFLECWLEKNRVLLPEKIQKQLMEGRPSLLDGFEAFGAEIAMKAFQQGAINFNMTSLEEVTANSQLWLDLKNHIVQESRKNYTERQKSLTDQHQRRALLSETDYIAIILRRYDQFSTGSPLKHKSSSWQFSHKSFFEFFVAKNIVRLKLMDEKSIFETAIALMNKRLFLEEPEVLNYLVEAWPEINWKMIESFFQIIIHSSKNLSIGLASSNAATMLNRGQVSFTGKNLEGSQLESADFTDGKFDLTNFRNANLKKVVFDSACLKKANLSFARMAGVEFRELPELRFGASIKSFCLSHKGNLIAVIMGLEVLLYDINSYEARHHLETDDVPDVREFVRSIINDRSIPEDDKNDRINCRRTPFSLSFSPDGKYIAAGNIDGTVRIWDAMTGAYEKALILERQGWATSIAFSPDGKTLAVGHNDVIGFAPVVGQYKPEDRVEALVNLWDVERVGKFKSLKGHRRAIQKVAFSADKKYLVSSSSDLAALWDITTWTCLKKFENDVKRTMFLYAERHVDLSPAGDKLVEASSMSMTLTTFNTYNIANWALLNSFTDNVSKGENNLIKDIAYSPDGMMVASLQEGTELTGNFVKLWDAATGAMLKVFEGPFSEKIAFTSDGSKLLTIQDKSIKFWDMRNIRTPTLKRFYKNKFDKIEALNFSPDGSMIVSTERLGIKLWDAKTGTLLRAISTYRPYTMLFNQDATKLFSVQLEYFTKKPEKVSIIDLREKGDPKIIQISRKDAGFPKTAKAIHYEQMLWGGINPNSELAKLMSDIYYDAKFVAISHNAEQLAILSDYEITILDVATAKTLKELKSVDGREKVAWLAFSPNSKQFATGGYCEPKRIWDLKNSWDDKDEGGFIRIWDIASGNSERSIKIKEKVKKISFAITPDKEQVVLYLTEDNQLKYYDPKYRDIEQRIEILNVVDKDFMRYVIGGRLLLNVAAFSCVIAENQTILCTGNLKGGIDVFKIEGHLQPLYTPGGYSSDFWRLDLKLLWSNHQRSLMLGEANVANSEGLSLNDIRLLKQHHVLGNPKIAPSTFSPAFEQKRKKEALELVPKTIGLERDLQGHEAAICCLESTLGGNLASGSVDKTIKIWDLKTATCLATLRGHTGSVRCLKLLPDGRLLSGSEDGTIKAWNINTGRCLFTLTGHKKTVLCLELLQNGLLVSGSLDKSLKFWNLQKHKCKTTIKNWKEPIVCLESISNGDLAINFGFECRIIHFTESTRLKAQMEALEFIGGSNYKMKLCGHTDSLLSFKSLQDFELASGGADNTVRIWKIDPSHELPQNNLISPKDHERGTCRLLLQGHMGGITAMQHSPKEHLLMSASTDHTIKVWNLETGQCLNTLNDHNDTVRCLKLLPNGKLVSGSDDKTLKVWNLAELVPTQTNSACCVML